MNSDGVADIIIGAYTASPNGIPYAGTAYVVFGKTTAWNSPLELSTLDGKNGFAINGVASRDFVGASVDTAGDVNGDGIDDIVIGAWDASPGGRTEAGSSYIVFGKKSAWNASLALSTLDGKNGFVINGVTAWSNSGCSVSTAGDVNSDGVADIIIGACTASPNGLTHAGTTYVVFGKTTAWNSPLELSTLDGKNGFAINGVAEGDSSGSSVNTAGDVNADGIVDIIIGTYNASPDGGYYEAGSSYVVFGKKAAWNASLELSALNGKNGFAINGFYNEGFTGISVSTAGDVNRDGIADVIIGSLYATMDSGSSYVVFGKKSAWNASLELLTLNGQNGFVVRGNGTNLGGLGPSVSTAGDINGDGISDILIGTPSALKSAGSSYVVFGQKSELGFFSHRTAAAPESPTVSANLGLKP